jgi:hypothetical protein
LTAVRLGLVIWVVAATGAAAPVAGVPDEAAALVAADSLLAAEAKPDPLPPLASLPAVAVATDSVPLPPGEIRGLAWLDGSRLAVLAADRAGPRGRSVRLQVVDRRGAPQGGLDVTGALVQGLAFDGQKLWSTGLADDGSALLYRLDADTLRIEESFPLPGHSPGGLACDGTFVYVTDRDGGSLGRFDPRSGEVNGEGLAPAFSPHGLAWDGRLLWLSDTGTGRLYRVDRSLALVDVVGVEHFALRGRKVVLAWRGGSLWYASAAAGHAYELWLP